jgi:hypothetical protein
MMRSASVHAFVADMKLGFRSLRRTPGFTVLAALTLALGIGGTITVFAAVHAAFFKPLPYPEEQAMVRIFQRNQRALRVSVPWLVANDYRDLSTSFASLGLWMGPGQANVTTGTEPRRAGVAVVTSGFFTAMGATPLIGRTFALDEITAGASPVALISERFWRDAMGRQADVLGSRLLLDGNPTPIVGVLPASFAFPVGTDVWTNLERHDADSYGTRTAHNFSVVARLKPGVTVARAQDRSRRGDRASQGRVRRRQEGEQLRARRLVPRRSARPAGVDARARPRIRVAGARDLLRQRHQSSARARREP